MPSKETPLVLDAGSSSRAKRVSVDPALGSELWQRVLEFAWARATPVRPGEPADLTVAAAPGNAVDACAGAIIVVRPGPLPATTPTLPTMSSNRRGGS